MFFTARLGRVQLLPWRTAPDSKIARLLNTRCPHHAHAVRARGDARRPRSARSARARRCGGYSASYQRASWTRSARVRAATRDARMRRRQFARAPTNPSRDLGRLTVSPPFPLPRPGDAPARGGIDANACTAWITIGRKVRLENHACGAPGRHRGRQIFLFFAKKKRVFESFARRGGRGAPSRLFVRHRTRARRAHESSRERTPAHHAHTANERTGTRVVHPRGPRADGGRRGPGGVRGVGPAGGDGWRARERRGGGRVERRRRDAVGRRRWTHRC